MNSFYSENELKSIGFLNCGSNVLISRKCSIYGAENISIGSNVRIDDFCILSGKITLGNYIHISAFASLYAGEVGIEMKDFSGISSKVAVYAISDDYSGNFMTNAMIPSQFRNVIQKKTIIGKHVIIGSGSIVLPGANICDGAAIGCMSLVSKPIEEIGIYCGIPAKKIKKRALNFFNFEDKL